MPNITQAVGSYWQMRLNWTQTTNEANNSSTITTRLYWESLNASGVSASSSKKANITIGQDTTSANYTPGLSGNQSKLIHSQTSIVKHNANGTKTINVGFSATLGITLSGTYYGTISKSENVTLTPIAKASTGRITKSWNVPDNPTYTITRGGSNNFTHTVELLLTANSNTIVVATRFNVGAGTITLNLTEAENKEIIAFQRQNNPSYYSAVARLRVRTYNGSTLVGTDTQTVYTECKQPASTIVESLTPSNNITLNTAFTATLKRSDISFVHRVDLALSPSHNVGTLDTKTNITNSVFFNIANYKDQILAARAEPGKVKLYLRVHTFYKEQIAESNVSVNKIRLMETYEIDVNVDEPPVFGSVPFTYINETTETNNITGSNQILVRSKSNLRVNFPSGSLATAKNGATITTYNFSVGTFSKTWNVATEGVPAFINNIPITTLTTNTSGLMTATDSMGNTATKSIALIVYDYKEPVVTTKTGKRQNIASTVKLNLSGSHSPINNTNYPNSIKYGTTSGVYTTNMTISHNNTGVFQAAATVEQPEDVSQTYYIEIRDRFNAVTTTTIFVDKNNPVFVIDTVNSAVGVNKTPTSNQYSLDVTGVARANSFLAETATTGQTLIAFKSGVNIGAITTSANKLYMYGSYGLILGGLVEFPNGISVNNVATFKVAPISQVAETGNCGIGITSFGSRVANAALAGYHVNFRMKKSYVPSSVNFVVSSGTGTISPNVVDITENGFWFYITNSAATATNQYYYWRGTYTC